MKKRDCPFRYSKKHVLKNMALTKTARGWECNRDLSRQTGGLSYADMVAAAHKARFRHTLWQIGEAIAEQFELVVRCQPLLQHLPSTDGPGWKELTNRWRSPPGRK